MSCAYCGAAVSIPELLRWTKITTSKPVEKPRFDPFAAAHKAVTPELRQKTIQQNQRVADILRKVEPVANTAYRGYFWWVLLKGLMVPGVLLLVSICCVVTLVTGGVIWFLSSR